MAGVLLGLLSALHLAAAIPAFHHFWHSHGDEHSECHESDCVVLAFAAGSIDPGPSPEPVTRPLFVETDRTVVVRDFVCQAWQGAEPPGRGPPMVDTNSVWRRHTA